MSIFVSEPGLNLTLLDIYSGVGVRSSFLIPLVSIYLPTCDLLCPLFLIFWAIISYLYSVRSICWTLTFINWEDIEFHPVRWRASGLGSSDMSEQLGCSVDILEDSLVGGREKADKDRREASQVGSLARQVVVGLGHFCHVASTV